MEDAHNPPQGNRLVFAASQAHNCATKLRPNEETLETILTWEGQSLAHKCHCLHELLINPLQQAGLRGLFEKDIKPAIAKHINAHWCPEN